MSAQRPETVLSPARERLAVDEVLTITTSAKNVHQSLVRSDLGATGVGGAERGARGHVKGTPRKQVLALIKVAAGHGDMATCTRLYAENRISRRAFDEAVEAGRQLATFVKSRDAHESAKTSEQGNAR